MRKIYLIILVLIFCTPFLHAQWVYNVNSIYNTNSENVGIGTNHPVGKLQILKSNSFGDPASTSSTVDNLLILQTPYQGNVPLTYNGTGYKWGIQFWGRNDAALLDQSKSGAIYAVSEDGQYGYNRAIGLAFHTTSFDATSSAERLRITATGDVGIGTVDTKGYRLAIAGSAIAESVTVKTQGNWPDYVFDKDFRKLSLSELESYLLKNRHLPDMPSAKEIEEKGQNLGEVNAKLLKNLEELTLHLIEKDKQLRQQQDRILAQDQRMDKLESALNKLAVNEMVKQ